MGSHSVTCHSAVVKIPPLPTAEAGTRFSDPRGMQGWVDLCCMKADRPGIESATCKSKVQRPTAKPPHNSDWIFSHSKIIITSFTTYQSINQCIYFRHKVHRQTNMPTHKKKDRQTKLYYRQTRTCDIHYYNVFFEKHFTNTLSQLNIH